MNLIDFSLTAGMSADEARRFIEEKYNFIILAETLAFPHELEEKMYNMLPAFTADFLENILDSNSVVMADTCAVMSAGFVRFMKTAETVFRKKNRHFVITYMVDVELHRNRSEKQLEFYSDLVEKGSFVIYHDENEWSGTLRNRPHADPVIFEKASVYRRQSINVLVITQDKNLTRDILDLNAMKSTQSKARIIVRKINDYGYLDEYTDIKGGK